MWFYGWLEQGSEWTSRCKENSVKNIGLLFVIEDLSPPLSHICTIFTTLGMPSPEDDGNGFENIGN